MAFDIIYCQVKGPYIGCYKYVPVKANELGDFLNSIGKPPEYIQWALDQWNHFLSVNGEGY